MADRGPRNLKISGKPTIPDSIKLSANPDLSGWLAEYYFESITGNSKDWEKKGEEIYGRRRTESPIIDENPRVNRGNAQPSDNEIYGSKQESVLQYHRPMIEDGRIDYEFFYESGKTAVHPALDRTAFLLDPAGIKIHTMTDGPYERNGTSPDNARDEPKCRKGPEKLPLKDADWNKLTITVKADLVTITLNGTIVYERGIEPGNQRNFGLFHYADETEARVRNVVYTGDWPKALPEVHDLSGNAPAK